MDSTLILCAQVGTFRKPIEGGKVRLEFVEILYKKTRVIPFGIGAPSDPTSQS